MTPAIKCEFLVPFYRKKEVENYFRCRHYTQVAFKRLRNLWIDKKKFVGDSWVYGWVAQLIKKIPIRCSRFWDSFHGRILLIVRSNLFQCLRKRSMKSVTYKRITVHFFKSNFGEMFTSLIFFSDLFLSIPLNSPSSSISDDSIIID